MGLKASNRQERELSPQEIVNIVAEELEMDPEGTMGQNLVKHRIAMRTGMHLKQYVPSSSHTHTDLTLSQKDSLRASRAA